MAGGARAGAGKKRKSGAERVLEGKETAESPIRPEGWDSVKPIPGLKAPKYLSETQEDGTKLGGGLIYRKTCAWLTAMGCRDAVASELIEEYALAYARWQQLEQRVSREGLDARHPTTGAQIASPYVRMAQDYAKEAKACFLQIWQVVRDQTANKNGAAERDEMMERLLQSRSG